MTEPLMSTAYLAAFNLTVLGQEGGFVLSTLRGDRGGQTYAGISRVNFPEWAGWRRIDAGDRQSNYLKELVYEFYYGFAWQRMSLGLLPRRTAALVFDFAVNSGRTIAALRLQKWLGVTADGNIGPKTIAATSAADPLCLSMHYMAERLDYLNDLKAWDTFSEGWSQRVVRLLHYAAETP